MKKVSILNGYGFIDESGTITNSHGLVRKPSKMKVGDNTYTYLLIAGKNYKVIDFMIDAFFPKFNRNTQKLIFIDGNDTNLCRANLKVVNKHIDYKSESLEKEKAIKFLNENGFPYSKLVKIFGMSKSSIARICRNTDL